MQGAALKTTVSHPPVLPPCRLLLPPTSLPHTPRHLEEEIKRASAQRQTLIPPTPAADALLPTPIPRVVAQPVSNLLPRSTPPSPPDTLAMVEGTTPSRETLPSREVLGWCGSVGWVVWVGTGTEGGGNCFPLGLTVLTVPNLRSYH